MSQDANPSTLRREVYVAMGSLTVGSSPHDILKTFVGSCVGVCLYDNTTRQGALAHVVLPESNGKPPASEFDARYADHAIRSMVSLIERTGGNKRQLSAHIAGGAKMFSIEGGNAGLADQNPFNIGDRNVASLKSLLSEHRIPLLSEDTGANHGRWIFFDPSSGTVDVVKRTKGQFSS